MSTADQLLSEIEQFCARHQMSETTFGRESVRDGHLVRRLRTHKSLTTKRLDQVREFMAERDAALASSGAGPVSETQSIDVEAAAEGKREPGRAA